MLLRLKIAGLAVLGSLLVVAGHTVRLPAPAIHNRSALYILAEYKAAIGDRPGAAELLTRISEPLSCPLASAAAHRPLSGVCVF